MSVLSDLRVPAYWAEGQPHIPLESYVLRISGLVSRPRELTLGELSSMSTDEVSCRVTSVTRWTVRVGWRGILMRRIVELSAPLQGATHAMLTSFGDAYCTSVSIEDLAHPRAIVALQVGGEDLPVEYGGPVRAVFPQLWGYKSAKSIVRIHFLDRDEPGYWETRGYPGDSHITATKLHDLNSAKTRYHGGGEVEW